jgi:translocator protein
MLPALTTAWLAPGEWYADLKKPDWAPSAWMFEPIWMAVGLLMGVAGWLLARQPRSLPRAQTMVTYVIQVALSAVWPLVFFGTRRLDMTLVTILLLWFAVVVVVARAWWVQRTASLLLVPYLAWITFAVAFSGAIFVMNR